MPLFTDILGGDFALLPEPVRRFHQPADTFYSSGRATITGQTTFLARALAFIAGLPKPGKDVECFVKFELLSKERQQWKRLFAGRPYQSIMEAGPSKDHNHILVEHFGPFDLYFALSASERGLRWTLDSWRLLTVPLPKFTLPSIDCFESGLGDAFVFDIDVAFPIVGHVVHYSGTLREDPASAPQLTYNPKCASFIAKLPLNPEGSLRVAPFASPASPSSTASTGIENTTTANATLVFSENHHTVTDADALVAASAHMPLPARACGLAFGLLPASARAYIFNYAVRK